MTDMQKMTDHLNMEVVENLFWVAAKAADPEIPDIDTWLSQFGPYSIVRASGALMEAWNEENETMSTPKKKVTL